MPYDDLSNLPNDVKELPLSAQNMWLSSFNSTFTQYEDEVSANAVAWASVKKNFIKDSSEWVAKSDFDFGMYANFSKFDEEQRMVYGYATTDAIDSQGEVVDLEATANAVTDYLNWRNIRVMHKAEPVGVAPLVEMRKEGLWVGAKIVDDDAWNKVKTGVYKGFSIGGKKVKMVTEFSEKLGRPITRIKEYLLKEISLVDRPSCPNAKFAFIKRNDSEVESVNTEIKKDADSEVEKEVVQEVEPTKEESVVDVNTEEAKVEAEPVGEVEETKAEEETKEEDVEVEKADASEETMTLKKSEYDELIKNSELAKKQEEFLDLVKSKLENDFEKSEPKELIEKSNSKPMSIGEVSTGPNGWLNTN